jgi:hypothetical protein
VSLRVRRRDRRRADGDTRVRRHVPERPRRTCDYNQGSLTEGRQAGIEDRLYKRIFSRRDRPCTDARLPARAFSHRGSEQSRPPVHPCVYDLGFELLLSQPVADHGVETERPLTCPSTVALLGSPWVFQSSLYRCVSFSESNIIRAVGPRPPQAARTSRSPPARCGRRPRACAGVARRIGPSLKCAFIQRRRRAATSPGRRRAAGTHTAQLRQGTSSGWPKSTDEARDRASRRRPATSDRAPQRDAAPAAAGLDAG